MKKKKGNIRRSLFLLAVVPIIGLGAAALLLASAGIYRAMAAETRDELENLAYALYQICDA